MLTSYDSYDSAPKSEPHPLHAFRTVAVLRIGAGLVLFLQYGLEGVLRAYHFVWKKAPWDLVDAASQAGLPFAQILLPAAAVITVAVAIAWMAGFLTRFFSIIFVPVLVAALPFLDKMQAGTHITVCWLLMFTSVTLMLYGSGVISVDGLFRLGSQPKKKKR